MNYDHYFKDVSRLERIDVYRVLALFGVTDPCIQHAVKKLLVAGGRGEKNKPQDIEEAIASLQRWQAMRTEDEREVAQTIVVGAGGSGGAGIPVNVPTPSRWHEVEKQGLGSGTAESLRDFTLGLGR